MTSIAYVRLIRAKATWARQRSFARKQPRLIRCHNLILLSSAPGRPKRNLNQSSLKWTGGAGIERRRFTIHDLRFTIYSLTEIRFTTGHESRGFAQKVDSHEANLLHYPGSGRERFPLFDKCRTGSG